MFMAYGIILFSHHVMTFSVTPSWSGSVVNPYAMLYQVIVAMVIWAHLMTMLSDPGAVPKDNAEIAAVDLETGLEKMCKKCNAPKPPKAHHCSICNRCIMKMDHHCPWVNNCVGEYNQKHFLLFLIYVFILSTITLAMLVSHVYNCEDARTVLAGSRKIDGNVGTTVTRRQKQHTICGLPESTVMMCLIVFFISLLFALFTCAMFCDQTSGLMQDQTKIDKLQNEFTRPRSLRAVLHDVFGGPFSWRWFLPLPIKKAYRDITI